MRLRISSLTACLLLGALLANAESLEERIKNYGKSYGTGYLQPFADAFGASLNSGWYRTADVSNGLSLSIGVNAMFMPVPDGAKNFSYANPFGNTDVVPTVFGPKVSKPVTGGEGLPSPYNAYAQGFDVSYAMMAVPQISAGNIFGTRVILRILPSIEIGDYGKFSFFGIGAQHSISQYIPLIPLDIAAHIGYQNLSLGDLLKSSAFTFGAEASKSFAILTLYGGLAYETSTMSFSYTATYYPSTGAPISQNFGFDLTGTNNFRATIGLALNLGILKLNADYSAASQPVATVGVFFGI